MSILFPKYPQLQALTDRDLFLSGKLVGSYGIIWNEDLDIEVETIYEEGTLLRHERMPVNVIAAYAVGLARMKKGMTQKDLAAATGIDQSDISKIERGAANPSLKTLARIADALDAEVRITIE